MSSVNNYPPDRRKHGYSELEAKLQKHAEYLESRLRRFFTKALFAFAILGLTSAGALLGFGVVLKQQSATDKTIQQQRYDSNFDLCMKQNRRHDRTILRAKKILPSQAQKAVTLMVDELQPFVKNCDAEAKRRVKGTTDAE